MNIDLDAILAPIPGDNPAGEDLRYTQVYDEIKEARRADDPLDRGDWGREIKTADWDKVIKISVDALTEKTKDLQIAAWLTEALTRRQGFEGLAKGLRIILVFLLDFWEHLYPDISDGDLEFRSGPLEFLNNNLWLPIKEVPITDSRVTPGYSWLKWQESRTVGYEKDTLNQYGDADEAKKAARDEKIAEGKLTAEDFDAAVAASTKAFYVKLDQTLGLCLQGFKVIDETVDEKFGKEAPRLSEFRQALEDCETLIVRILKEKRVAEPDAEPQSETSAEDTGGSLKDRYPAEGTESESVSEGQPGAGFTAGAMFSSTVPIDSDVVEQALWKDALNTLQKSGIKDALSKLLNASCGAPSVRQKNRYRLLIAKLCLKAGRPDLARPIIDELHTLIQQLNLEQWESPIWIAEVIDAFYQCLTAEGASDDDIYRARNELFQRLCSKDITKAIIYK
ncbi:Type VI secretion-associated protein, ImpA family [uncultured Desulfobacterium sp.]|uniref:Type VI secretion-associated protein, ImpA family n=1 Tax=uncultured Desulfobacterium sp. TaxID=201089 RepID=A0A445MTN9_9BACT|nr:Type VI secretion-associated protein, ImpA family [uncultured Desulfobacterium sp.]